jgi:hypothetical protein
VLESLKKIIMAIFHVPMESEMEWRHDVEAKRPGQGPSEARNFRLLWFKNESLRWSGYSRGAELKAMQERRIPILFSTSSR